MELQIDRERRELKNHGTYSFPVNLSRKKLSSYLSGAFPWHWHDEVELTLVLHGEIDYRVNDSRYLLHRGEGLFCNADAFMPALCPEKSTVNISPSPFIPGFYQVLRGA